MRQVRTQRDQIDQLRRMGDSRVVMLLLPASVIAGIAGSLLAMWADREPMRVVGLFVAGLGVMFAFGLRGSMRHLRNAATGTRKGRRELATLMLHPNSDDGGPDHHPLCVLTPLSGPGGAWSMQLVPGDGWRPPAGAMQVEAVYLSDIAWPVLMIHPDGILWPQRQPRPRPGS